MSRKNVEELVFRMENGKCSIEGLNDPVTPGCIITLGQTEGIPFSENDLAAFLRLRIANAESLPRPWGWSIARTLGVVRG